MGAHDWNQENPEVAGKSLTEWGDHFMVGNPRRNTQSLNDSGEELGEGDLKCCS